jgi:hypothetical protein
MRRQGLFFSKEGTSTVDVTDYIQYRNVPHSDGWTACTVLVASLHMGASERRSTFPTISHVFIFVCIPPCPNTSEYINVPVSQILMLKLEMDFNLTHLQQSSQREACSACLDHPCTAAKFEYLG